MLPGQGSEEISATIKGLKEQIASLEGRVSGLAPIGFDPEKLVPIENENGSVVYHETKSRGEANTRGK